VKKVIYITIFLILAGGCSSPLKRNWNDFKAYYNTHYNTKKYFREGLEKNQSQVTEINPRYPIRIHESQIRAGSEDFQKAIDGGATILRDYKESSFLEPALAIIGKSYYYLTEYFSALEKFQELNSIADGKYEQEAILWEGLVLLQMGSFNEGISFLESELSTEREWEKNQLAEIKAVLAQHYVEREEWDAAVHILGESLDDLNDSKIKARAYFLYGQLLEILGNLDEALLAYSDVPVFHPPYTLIFNSNKKRAQIYRKMGELHTALTLFEEMARDDKNMDRRADLQYEIARTHQMSGNYDRAIHLYNRILRNELRPPDDETKAKIYYTLGEVYRFQKPDFTLAATYFDSAAAQRADPYRLPADFNALELAESFGEYAKTQKEISRIDSLITLGTMDPVKLDSVLNHLQQQLEEERREELKRLRDQRNVLTTVDSEQMETSTIDSEAIRNNGFLNIRNRRVLTDASIQFRVIWGERPLVDNWRREEAVSGSRSLAQQDDSLSEDEFSGEDGAQKVLERYTMDVSEIPITGEQQDSMRTVLQERYYRLANVFFLSLEMPDSATVYLKKVVENEYNQQVKPGALYTLAEIELQDGKEEKALEYAAELIEKYPQTEFARRIQYRINGEIPNVTHPDTQNHDQLNSIKNDFEDSASRATYLQKYAMNEASDDRVPLILYEAAREYMKAAKEGESTEKKINRWYLDKSLWEARKKKLDVLKDSANVVLSDSTLSDKKRDYWQSIADSVLQQPDFTEIYPFQGGYWDSTRSVLNHIDTYYASSIIKPRVDRLRQSLQPPEPSGSDSLKKSNRDLFDENRDSADDEMMDDCNELNISPEIEGGMNSFLSKIVYPQWTDGVVMRGDIEFELIIRTSGEVASYEQVSRMSRTGIPQAFEQAIENELRFEPLPLDNTEMIRCTVTFPIDLE